MEAKAVGEGAIPKEQRILLEVNADRYGIHQQMEKLLRELNDQNVDWAQTLENLHSRAMSDFSYYNNHKRGADAVGAYCGLYTQVAQQSTPASLREVGIRNWLYYLQKIVSTSEQHLLRNSAPIGQALRHLGEIFHQQPAYAVASTPGLRRLTEAVLAVGESAKPLLKPLVELLSAALERCYKDWLMREDPVVWFRQRRFKGLSSKDSLPEAVVSISHDQLKSYQTDLEDLCARKDSLEKRARELLTFPSHARITRSYLEAVSAVESAENEEWQNQLERIHWLVRVVSSEALASVHEMALREIRRCYEEVLESGDRSKVQECIHETFTTLRNAQLPETQTVDHLVTTIGLKVLAARDAAWADAVIDEIINWDFHYPEFQGYTEKWAVQVNPAHLKDIRTYLTLIQSDPHLARRLLAALVVHLKMGGVFIADTDLFQKDISRFLSSDIGSVYHQSKHLLKLFPAYFSDIGAEGELRELSTRIDEMGKLKDPLCHFLRKLCHVESNPRLISFIEAIAHFWATGDREPLGVYMPPNRYQDLKITSKAYKPLHRIMSTLAGSEGGIEEVFTLEGKALKQRLLEVPGVGPLDVEKVELLFRLRHLLLRKYALTHDHLLDQLQAFEHLNRGQVKELERALAAERHEASLEILLGMLEKLKEMILSEEETQAIEDIYHKRHVAVGIPSMSGRYLEMRFQAMGLTFRIESLANVLFEEMIASQNLEYITKSDLQRICRWLHLVFRALRVDGCRATGLKMGISMLEQALQAQAFTVDQFINIFQFISHGIHYLIRVRFLDVYEGPLQRIVERMFQKGLLDTDTESNAREEMLKVGETFLRDLIAESFGLQRLDNLLGRILYTLTEQTGKLDHTGLNLLMTYDVERCFSDIYGHKTSGEGNILLGYKGYMLKELACQGFPVPPGFILTTEAYRCRSAILDFAELQHENVERIRKQIAKLERLTGSRFGDPVNPLLLSVRSSAAISMPGMLDTFLNVGMNPEIAAGFAAKTDRPWAAWDAYRRFLQFWGMSFGINRDLFDGLMGEAKQKHSVPKKSLLPPEMMKELALRYRALLLDHELEIVDDPFEQLMRCIDLVMQSWQSNKARVYRSELKIADEWGTAVLVQNMVYGNLHAKSGTGALFTHHPREGPEDVQLYGDFIIQGQGDDVVSGLVDTFPVSEHQRLSENEEGKISLEKDFPKIYQSMLRYAENLIHEQEMHHQEIEFTFESDNPKDLYILQTRDIVFFQTSSLPTFVAGQDLEDSKAATGIGVGGGAVSGRVAHTAEDLTQLKKQHPDDPIILLRPDTVPDDIHLILKADGLLTALGGATSHAALAAQRLGRTCVVGCRLLQVSEEKRESQLAGHVISTGEFLSINGIDGSVYLGRHPVTITKRHGLMR
jgi:pyruvate,orthophosphate dikinase